MDFGGSSSSSNTFSPAAHGAGQSGKKLFNEFNAPLQELLNQVMEGLSTGGIGAAIPILQNAISASKAATSQAVQGFEAEGAKTGAANSPAFQGEASALGMSGAQSTAAIPSQYIQNLISVFSNLFPSGIGTAAKYQGLAIGGNNTNTSNTNQFGFSL